MKRVLIVHAHPEPQSFSSSLKAEAVREFEAAGCEVRVSDLYAKRFNPVASPDDFAVRARADYLVYALEQRSAYQSSSLAPDIAEEVANVIWADLVILNFPIFWFSVPAIMKGWIDRVLLSGPFYGGLRFYDRGGMVGKTAWVTHTLGGRPHMFGPRAIHGELETMLTHLLRGTLGYVGFRVLKPFAGFHIPYISPEERDGVMESFRQAIRHIQSREALEFPSLDQFDGQLYPIEMPSDV
jgi:NAD(P)H dehydrogenase (quinone)